MISIRSLFFIGVVLACLVSGCAKTSGAGLNLAGLLGSSTDAPTKDFWSARKVRGIVGQTLSKSQWYEVSANRESMIEQQISSVTSNGGQEETLFVNKQGDVFYGSTWFTGPTEVGGRYAYVGSLNVATMEQFRQMMQALNADGFATNPEVFRGPCPELTNQFTAFIRSWYGSDGKDLGFAARLEMGQEVKKECVVKANSPNAEMRKFVTWSNYLYWYATQQ